MKSKPGKQIRSRGFTLIELLVTVAVAAVLLGIAVPSFRDLSIRNNLAGRTNDMIATINFARSEAIRIGEGVTICHSNDQASCSGTWSDGWIVFRDDDADQVVDGDPERVLKAYGPLPTNYSLGSDAALSAGVTYRRDGSAANTGMFALCHEGEREGARAIVVTSLRPRLAADTNSDRIPNREDGANITSCDAPGADPDDGEDGV